MLSLSKRIESMQASPIRKLVPYSDLAKQKGIGVYHLNIGQPDIETPPAFFDAIKNFNEPVVSYMHSGGLPQLKEAVASYYQGLNYPYQAKDILITTGGSEALSFAITAVCDPSDSILIPEPFYTNYNGFSEASGVHVIPIPTSFEDGFRLPSLGVIKSLVQPNTKAILLNNPANPTGVVLSSEELNTVKTLALEHGLFIIMDEVYREFIYDGEFNTLAVDPEINQQVIVIDSVSKRFSACGARIGSAASLHPTIISNMLKMGQSRLSVATLEQVAAVELYRLPYSYFVGVRQEYERRRDIVMEELGGIAEIKIRTPQGAFYVMADIGVDSEAFAIWMLESFHQNQQTVMVAPGSGFYATPGKGSTEIRIAYVIGGKQLRYACQILVAGLTKFKADSTTR